MSEYHQEQIIKNNNEAQFAKKKAEEDRATKIAEDKMREHIINSKGAGIKGDNYHNPLDEFKTFSTHFILTVSNSTEAFRKSVGGTGATPRIISEVSNKKIGEEINLDGSKAYLLIDTRRFSQYSVTDLDFESATGAAVDNMNPFFVSSTVKLKLVDSTGLSFFNLLMDTARNKLQTSALTANFLLNIVFVGHPDDGADPVVVSTSNLMLNMSGIGFELLSSGGLIDMTFVEMSGLVGSLGPGNFGGESDYLGNVRTITTEGSSNTIGSLIDSLETQLNVQSIEYYQKFASFIGADKKKRKYGKLVQYMITLPDEIRNFPADLAVQSGNKELNFLTKLFVKQPTESNTKKPDTIDFVDSGFNSTTVSLSKTATISESIIAILKKSNKFLEKSSDAAIAANLGQFVRTSITNTSDDNTHVLHFDIIINQIPTPNRILQEFKNNNPINIMSYDYIFTGKNSHILDFKLAYSPAMAIASIDLEQNIGKKRLADNSAAGQKKQDVKDVNKGVPKTTDETIIVKPYDPVFFAFSSKDVTSDNAEQYDEGSTKEDAIEALRNKQNFAKTYAKINFLGTTRADLVIRGNPNIIKKYGDRNERGGIPPHPSIVSSEKLISITSNSNDGATNFKNLVSQGLANAKAEYINNFLKPRALRAEARKNVGDDLLNGIDVTALPVFVKINIKYPNVGYRDYSGNSVEGEDMFTSDFFFNGVYQILKAKTLYQGGSFTQSLTIIPWSASDPLLNGDENSVLN